jgi:hypothetical protein
VRELFDFARVFVEAGSVAEVELLLNARVLAAANVNGVLAVWPGKYVPFPSLRFVSCLWSSGEFKTQLHKPSQG